MNILPNFFEPVFYLLAIGFGLGQFIKSVGGVDYATYIAPGLAASSAMFGASFDVTFNVFVKLHFERLYDAVTVTPLSPEDVWASLGLTDIHQVGSGPREDVFHGKKRATSETLLHAGVQG